MHEMSIAMALMNQLEELAEQNELARIEKVEVVAGIMRGIVPEAMQLAFSAVAKGSCIEDAELELRIEPAVAACRACAHEFEPGLDCFLCPRCGQADVAVIQGDDIVLASVTGEQRDNGKESP